MQITADRLGHRFAGQDLPLFENINFTMNEGDLVALRGASGSGKSTLLSMLAGWLKAQDGTLRHEGITSMTWVPQNPYGVSQRSALDHACLPLIAAGYNRTIAENEASEALNRFGLEHVADRNFSQLSGGEAQRLMLARATLLDASLVLVDEPTAQLDPHSAAAVIAVLHQLASSGRIVVVATHDPRVAETCTSTILMGAR